MNTSPSTRFPLKPLAILLGIFLLGMLAGSGLLMLKVKHSLQSAVKSSSSHPDVEKSFIRLGNLLSRRLELSQDESTAVMEELQVTVEKLTQIRVNLVLELDRETQDTLGRIARHIPAEKQNLLSEIAEKRLRPWGLLDPDKPEPVIKKE